jgi:hypothetical protein
MQERIADVVNFFKKKPDDVFTPRSPTVNEEMYVDRSDLESRLKDLISGTKHIIIHGESGNGKTWLYKKVFSEEKVPYAIVNLSNAGRFGTISNAIRDKLSKASNDETELKQIVSNFEGNFQPEGVGIGYSRQKIYEVVNRDPLDALMRLVRSGGGRKKGLIVFDNFEAILNDDALIAELGNMLILLDDEDYAKHSVKICIVGVPADIRDYITKMSAVQSISNRISELPEVARLTSEQAQELLKKGFKKLLNIKLEEESRILDQLAWSTDRIAQYLHELGLIAAREAVKRNSILSLATLDRSEGIWFEESISSVRQTVELNLNARETKAGRRNQVIYSLGCLKIEDFKYSDVETLVRQEFPETTTDVDLNIIQRLGELEKSSHPVIKRVPRGDAYRLINPKVKIAIRVMLRKANGKVEKVPHLS